MIVVQRDILHAMMNEIKIGWAWWQIILGIVTIALIEGFVEGFFDEIHKRILIELRKGK